MKLPNILVFGVNWLLKMRINARESEIQREEGDRVDD